MNAGMQARIPDQSIFKACKSLSFKSGEEPFYNYLPNVPISDLEINETEDQLLAEANGKYIRDIASFKGNSDVYTYPINNSDLDAGFYYLYLVVNDEVVHLQEMDLLEN